MFNSNCVDSGRSRHPSGVILGLVPRTQRAAATVLKTTTLVEPLQSHPTMVRLRRLLPAWSTLIAAMLFASPVYADSPNTFVEAKSPGGIAFLHRFDGSTPYAAVNFGWRDTPTASPAAKAGLPALNGSLLMQGADGSAENSLVELLKDLSASASLSGGTYQFRGQVRAPAANLAEAMQLTASALKTAVPSDKVFRRLLQQVTEGEAAALTRSDAIAQRAALQLSLGDHPVVRAFAADRFDGLAPADVTAWRKRSLDRTGLRVVVSGKVTAADAGVLLDKAFGDLPVSVSGPLVQPPALTPLKPRTIVIERETAQSAVLLIGLTDIVNGPPAQIANIANATLGSGSDGRIFQAVRVALGASYGGGSGFQFADPTRRLVQLTATVGNEAVAPAVLAMRRTYATWHSDGITEAELKSAVTRAIGAVAEGFKDPASASGLALNTIMTDRPISDLHDYVALMQALRVPDLNDLIKTQFPKPDQLMTVIVTPSAARLIEAGITTDCVIRTLADVATCKR
jgi:zinc protease